RILDMKSLFEKSSGLACIVRASVWTCVSAWALQAAAQPASKAVADAAPISTAKPKLFGTPQQPPDPLISAAKNLDAAALAEIFGPDGDDIVFSGEFAQDKKHAAEFAAQAREKLSVSVDPKTGRRAFLLVGSEDWPFPVPLVQKGGKWFF